MRKLLILGASLVLAGVGCSANPPKAPSPGGVSQTVTPATQTASTPATFTMADVQAASTAQKCWTVVNGKVYDLTSAESTHPGGKQAILSMCGKDASSAFENKHGGQRRPEQDLQNLQIGTLK